jgi:hypothetical protein
VVGVEHRQVNAGLALNLGEVGVAAQRRFLLDWLTSRSAITAANFSHPCVNKLNAPHALVHKCTSAHRVGITAA